MYLRDSTKIINLKSIPGENVISENYDYSRRPSGCMRSGRHFNMFIMMLVIFILLFMISAVAYKILF